MENLIAIIVQLVSGGIGGNIAGIANKLSLGPTGNSIAGAIGGILGGQGMQQLLGTTADSALSGAVGQAAGSGVAGIILTAIIGFIRNAFAKK